MAEQHVANPYDNGHRVHSDAIPEAERERLRDQHAAAVAAEVERLDRHRVVNPRRGAISLGSSGMTPPPPPTFPPPVFVSGTPAAVLEAERNRITEQRRAALSSGSLAMPPPPLPSYETPGVATVNPATVSGAAEPSVSGRNRLRSESNPWGPPPPPRPFSGFTSFDGASSQSTAGFNNDEDRTRPATFQEVLDRNRSRNSEPYTRGSGPHGPRRFPAPSTAMPPEFPLSTERPSLGTADPVQGSFSAAIQEAADYNRGLAAQDTDSGRRQAPLPPATERAPPLSTRELEAMNRAIQPRNRPRNYDMSTLYQEAGIADTMTRRNTRRRAVTARYEFISYDVQTVQSAEQRASYLRLSNEKIESFVHRLPVHVILDLPADKQDCAICMEKYYGPHQQECPIRLPCNHVLGKACLLAWLKSSPTNRNNNCCPICRTVLLERFPILPPIDDIPDDLSDLGEEDLTNLSTALDEATQFRRELQRERIAMERDVERNAHQRSMTEPEGEHEHARRIRESEENHQMVLARLRRDHAARMESLENIRGERRRRRTGS